MVTVPFYKGLDKGNGVLNNKIYKTFDGVVYTMVLEDITNNGVDINIVQVVQEDFKGKVNDNIT